MTYVIRAAFPADLPALLDMAMSTGGGFTNLPPDRAVLAAKLEAGRAAFSGSIAMSAEDTYLFVLEDFNTGKARGTCQLISQVGSRQPFYSYRLDSPRDSTGGEPALTLCTDHQGCSEVGGLFLNPSCRSAGAGGLLARSRYLFIRNHRKRFAGTTISELRGWVDDEGKSPFWDAVTGAFLPMKIEQAALMQGTSAIRLLADLLPKKPISLASLPEPALQALGNSHRFGQAAKRMLEKEGFRFKGHVHILDGGSILATATDEIATLRNARDALVLDVGLNPGEGVESLVAFGDLGEFRVCYGQVAVVDDGIFLDRNCADALSAMPGDHVTFVPR